MERRLANIVHSVLPASIFVTAFESAQSPKSLESGGISPNKKYLSWSQMSKWLLFTDE